MKTTNKLMLFAFLLCMLFSTAMIAQEEEESADEFEPVFLTITTMHRTSDPDVDLSDWLDVEKEFHEHVTMKNDLIIGSGFYMHYFSPDDTEIIQVSVYRTWEDIENAVEKTNELIMAHWSEEEARNAYFDKRASYYDGLHSDEIMASTPYSIPLDSIPTKPLVYYVKNNQRGNGGGSGFEEYYENVTKKNKYLKGYYTHVHRYGANSNDVNEVFVFESLADIEKSFDEENRLVEEHWPDEEAREEFFKGYNKIFPKHGDAVYRNVPPLMK